MVLTNISGFEQVEEWVESIKSIAEGIPEIESIIGFVVLIAGVVATCWKAFISISTILSSYNIEIALMTKKERVKMNATSISVLIISVCLLNLLCSYMAVRYTVNEVVFTGGIILLFGLAMSIICISILLFSIWIIKRISDIHVCRFIGVIIKKFLFAIGTGIYRLTAGLRSLYGKLANKIMRWKIIKCIRNSLMSFFDKVTQIWKSCGSDKNNNKYEKLTFSQKLRLSAFAITIVLGIVFNFELASYIGKTQNVYLLSLIVTITTMEIGLTFLNFQVTPRDSRIYYYDDTWKKHIFIYFRQDEKHCIGGDADVLSDCNELCLVPYEKLEMKKLYSISKWEQCKTCIDMTKIRLKHGRNEFILKEVYDKINRELIEKEIVPELMETADIYIKPDVKKAYYVLENNARGEIDL